MLVKGSQPDKATGGKAKGHSGNGQTSHAYSQFDPRRENRNDRNTDKPDVLVKGAQHRAQEAEKKNKR